MTLVYVSMTTDLSWIDLEQCEKLQAISEEHHI